MATSPTPGPAPRSWASTPEKIQKSLLRELDAFYDQHMFTNGLSTIQADELHSYEEGISTLGEALILNFGSPKQLERAMETSRRLEWLTGVNQAGHRHIKTNYFNGLKMSEEGVWGWQKAYSFLVFQPGALLVQFNGAPPTRKLILELADGLLAHRKPNASGGYSIHNVINFRTDEDMVSPMSIDWYVFWAAYKWTGDAKYLQPLRDEGPAILSEHHRRRSRPAPGARTHGARRSSPPPRSAPPQAGLHFAWQMTGDLHYLEQLYADQIEAAAVREYINTEGSLWIDRVNVDNAELQRARLGGVALVRNYPYPGHVVSWKFQAPASDQSVAVRGFRRDARPYQTDRLQPRPIAGEGAHDRLGNRARQVGDDAGLEHPHHRFRTRPGCRGHLRAARHHRHRAETGDSKACPTGRGRTWASTPRTFASRAAA